MKEVFCYWKVQTTLAWMQVQEVQPHLCSGQCSDFPAGHSSLLSGLSTDRVIVQVLVCEDSSKASNETAC